MAKKVRNNVGRLVEFPYEVERMVHECIVEAYCSLLKECKRDLAEMRDCQRKGMDEHAKWWRDATLRDLEKYRRAMAARDWYVHTHAKRGKVCRTYHGITVFK